MAADFAIRAVRAGDFERLKDIELDAFETLRDAGGVSGAASCSTDGELARYTDAGLLLTAVDIDDLPIGYVGAVVEDDCLHVAEIDVARAWQRRGVGRALMLAILADGKARGLHFATLTTDRLAPFNAPFYASLSFRILDEAALPTRLRTVLVKEQSAGFEPARRVAMIRRLDDSIAVGHCESCMISPHRLTRR